jgi:hypothetical protein
MTGQLRTAGLLTGSTSVALGGEGKIFSEQGGIVIVGQGPGATFKPAHCPSAACLLHSQT